MRLKFFASYTYNISFFLRLLDIEILWFYYLQTTYQYLLVFQEHGTLHIYILHNVVCYSLLMDLTCLTNAIDVERMLYYSIAMGIQPLVASIQTQYNLFKQQIA